MSLLNPLYYSVSASCFRCSAFLSLFISSSRLLSLCSFRSISLCDSPRCINTQDDKWTYARPFPWQNMGIQVLCGSERHHVPLGARKKSFVCKSLGRRRRSNNEQVQIWVLGPNRQKNLAIERACFDAESPFTCWCARHDHTNEPVLHSTELIDT